MEKIESKRLILRKLEAEDFNDFWELSKNWKTAPGPDFDKFPIDENGCKSWFNECLKNDGNILYIHLRDENKIIGLISFNGKDENERMDMGAYNSFRLSRQRHR
jgi:hypothetical protein